MIRNLDTPSQVKQTLASNIVLEPVDNMQLANLCGQFDEHLRQLERRFDVEINNRGNVFHINGPPVSVPLAGKALQLLYETAGGESLSPARVHLLLQDFAADATIEDQGDTDIIIHTRVGAIKGRSPNQRRYLHNIQAQAMNFGIGLAGTGKTFLAVACAVRALEHEQVRRVLLVRPAVEAGERLGFLPGDMSQKIDPYLRPLYDALYEMLGFDRVAKYIDQNIIEVAPLAFMRGRTLNESFVILDEAQNTTVEQMKMFLTRIGFGSKAVVTGDITQIDLPVDKPSGLRHVIDILKGVEGVSFTFFQARDVVRHPMIALILEAYERYEQAKSNATKGKTHGS